MAAVQESTSEFGRLVGLAIIEDLNTGHIKQALFGFPSEIRKAKATANAAKEALNAALLTRAEVEAELVVEITTATDENTGKAKYTNAEVRAAEMVRRKAASPEYVKAQGLVTAAEAALTQTQDALQELQDSQASYRTVGRLVAAELEAIAGLGTETEVFVGQMSGAKPQERQAF
jgi:hypothetical protein